MTRNQELQHITQRLKLHRDAQLKHNFAKNITDKELEKCKETILKNSPIMLACEHMLRILESELEKIHYRVSDESKAGLYDDMDYNLRLYSCPEAQMLSIYMGHHERNLKWIKNRTMFSDMTENNLKIKNDPERFQRIHNLYRIVKNLN